MNKGSRYFLWGVTIFSFIGILVCYQFLPEKIPINWNYKWEIDRLGEKSSILLLGALPVILLIIFEVSTKIDPRRDNYKKHGKAYDKLKVALVLLIILMNWITIGAALELDIHLKFVFPVVLGVVFIIIGNYLPKFKSNYFIGIKNPWTLSNDIVWRKTHKTGGYLITVLGVLMIIMGFVQNQKVNLVIVILFVVGILGINIYSYHKYLKINKK